MLAFMRWAPAPAYEANLGPRPACVPLLFSGRLATSAVGGRQLGLRLVLQLGGAPPAWHARMGRGKRGPGAKSLHRKTPRVNCGQVLSLLWVAKSTGRRVLLWCAGGIGAASPERAWLCPCAPCGARAPRQARAPGAMPAAQFKARQLVPVWYHGLPTLAGLRWSFTSLNQMHLLTPMNQMHLLLRSTPFHHRKISRTRRVCMGFHPHQQTFTSVFLAVSPPRKPFVSIQFHLRMPCTQTAGGTAGILYQR